MKKIYTEIGFGNSSFLSTEIEEGYSEYRIAKFLLPKKIEGIYLRIWIFKKVFILSTNEGLKIQNKEKNKFKLLFGFSGEDLKCKAYEYSGQYIGKIIKIEIDRPVNSQHPKHGFVYELNYGFVPGTKAPDGEEVDAYLIGIDKPVSEYTGKCVAIIHRLNNNDDKLVVVSENLINITDKEIIGLTHFQEKWFKSVIIR